MLTIIKKLIFCLFNKLIRFHCYKELLLVFIFLQLKDIYHTYMNTKSKIYFYEMDEIIF